MSKITKNVAADNSVSYTSVDTSFSDDIVDAVTAPFKAFSSDEKTFYSSRTMGIAALGWGVGGMVVGHKFGGSIPLLNRM